MRYKRRFASYAACLILSLNAGLSAAQDKPNPKPFIMPIATPASPSTWLLVQPYGNTTGAFNFGTAWYSAGQGLHFGIDIGMPCRTPLIAVGDGEVIYVDNLAFGAGPHNLILRHKDAGVTTLYGHLLERPPVQQYQAVKQGDVVGYSGDPDLTCDSRPHLHLEVRSLDYRTAYNPVDYIQAPWDALAAVGAFSSANFEQDWLNPRRWMSLDDQPSVAFGGARLNDYAQSWPPKNEDRAPGSASPLRPYTPLAAGVWQMQPVTIEGCCAVDWWHPTNPNLLYVIDGSPGQLAAIFEWDVTTNTMTGLIESVPPRSLSPDGTYQVIRANQQVTIQRLSDGAEWTVLSNGFPPSISPDNSHVLWEVQYGQAVPGAAPPQVEIWVSDIDGANSRQIVAKPRVAGRWLDGNRLLVTTSEKTLTTVEVVNVSDGSSYPLGTWDRLRGLSVAPGGGKVLFYQTFQPDTSANAVYALDTQAGAQPQKLAWFGGWRWRDAESLYYIPFDAVNGVQALHYYDLQTGEDRPLTDAATMPFTIANGAWSVSADGRRIAFQNTADDRLWVMEAKAD